MKKFLLINYIFCNRIIQKESSWIKCYIYFFVFLTFLLPGKIICENKFIRKYTWSYIFFLIVIMHLLYIYSDVTKTFYGIFIILVIVDNVVLGTIGWIITKIHPPFINILDKWMFGIHFRRYYLGNPLSLRSKIGAGFLSAFGLHLGLNTTEIVISSKVALTELNELAKAGHIPSDISHLEKYMQLKEQNFRAMPKQQATQFIYECI